MTIYPILRHPELSYPTSARRGRFWGGGAPGAWSDPTGLTWDYAWDFTSAPGGTADVPALVGGVDMPTVAGSYGTISVPSTVVPSGFGLAGTSLAANSAAWTATATVAALASTAALHLRYVGNVSGTGGFAEVGDSTTDGWLHCFKTGNTLYADYHHVGGARTTASITIPAGEYMVFDALVYTEGTGTRVDLYINGQSATVSSANTYDGIVTGQASISHESGTTVDAAFLGVRRSSSFTQVDHDAALNAVLSDVLISGRTFDYVWLAEDAASGTAWADTTGTISVPWNSRAGVTVTPGNAVPQSGTAAVASTRESVRIDCGNTNAGSVWQTSAQTDFVPAAGESVWIRMIGRNIPGNFDSVFGIPIQVLDNVSGIRAVRLDTLDNVDSNGGIRGQFWNGGSAVPVVANGPPNTHGELHIFDVFLDSSGSLEVMTAGKRATGTLGAAPLGMVDPIIAMFEDCEVDVVALQIATGTNADAYSQALHDHDTALLRAEVAAPFTSTWAPDSISSITAWYDPSDLANVTVDSSGVAELQDISGNSRHLTRASGSPALGVLSGRNALQAPAGSSMIGTPVPTNFNELWCFGVYNVETMGSSVFQHNGSPGYFVSNAPWTDGLIYFDVGGNSGPSRVVSTVGVGGNTNVVGWRNSATNSEQFVRLNGEVVASDATGQTSPALPLFLFNMDGVYGEFIFGSGPLSLADQERLEGYLAHRWGVASELPSGHPYRASPP